MSLDFLGRQLCFLEGRGSFYRTVGDVLHIAPK